MWLVIVLCSEVVRTIKKTFWAALLILRKCCSLQVISFPLALFSLPAPWLFNESLFTEIWLHHPFLPIPFTIYSSLIDFVFTSNFSVCWQKYTRLKNMGKSKVILRQLVSHIRNNIRFLIDKIQRNQFQSKEFKVKDKTTLQGAKIHCI